MKKKWNFNLSAISRRDFIKNKVLGGLLFTSGLPLLGLTNIIPQREPSIKLPKFKKDGEIDWSEIRKQFPLSKKGVSHFNTASLGPSPQIVISKICSSLEDLATRARDGRWLISGTRKKISKFLNSSSQEIAITRNATEGMNTVARSLPLKAGDEILLTNHEHIGGAAPWIALQKDIGVNIKIVDLNLTGKNNLEIIRNHITEKTKVVSVSHITCTTGMLLPVKEIVDVCRNKGIYSCIDGAQAIGMVPIDLSYINPDFYVCSGHKWLFGPKGTGILFINKLVIRKCSPVYVGSNTDKKYDLNSLTLEFKTTAEREEYGTRNAPMVIGLESAIDFISTIGIENVASRSRELANYFRKGLSLISEVKILTPESAKYSASIITIRIVNRDNHLVKEKLRKEKSIRIREVYENNLNGIRVSFAIFNTKEEVDKILTAIKEIVSE